MTKTIDVSIAKLYKQESSKLLGVLTRIFGTHNFTLAEDVLQEAFAKAWDDWQHHGIPANPAAWLLTTAKHKAIDVIRSQKTKVKFSKDLAYHLESEWTLGTTIEEAFTPSKIKDDQLRMIFMCCHESIKPENQIPFILKALCGLSISAIAKALLLPKETIKKRLFRTRKSIAQLSFDIPTSESLNQALNTVHTVLYLLFNEGFHCSNGKQNIQLDLCQDAIALVKLIVSEPSIANRETLALFALMHFHSSSGKQSIQLDLCQDAIALVKLIVEEPDISNRETLALFALMHFHIARIDSRMDMHGCLIPIDLQDRNLWTKAYIHTGNQLLNMATSLSSSHGRFYFEASLAKEHCNTTSFEATNWANIIAIYDKLIQITDSPIAKLNQAIAIAYAGEINEAMTRVEKLQQHPLLRSSHLPWATLAHLHAKSGCADQAYTCMDKAKALGGTPQEQALMLQQVERSLQG